MKHPNEAIQRYGLPVHTELDTPMAYALNKDTERYGPWLLFRNCCDPCVKFNSISFPGCMASAEALKNSLVTQRSGVCICQLDE
jgi:hypothetical protein